MVDKEWRKAANDIERKRLPTDGVGTVVWKIAFVEVNLFLQKL
jgi:hypothetical protein